MKQRGRIPEKEVLAMRVQKLSQSVKNVAELKKVLEQSGIRTYERNGTLTGIWNDKGTRKYRLRKLGIDAHNLNRILSKEQERKLNRKRNR